MHWPNVGVMLVHRLRRWPSFKTTLVQLLVFAGIPFIVYLYSPGGACSAIFVIRAVGSFWV